MLTHGVRRLPDGRIRVRLAAREHELLRSLPAQLRPVLAGEQQVGDSAQRLFPPAYDDLADETEYRELVGDDLTQERLAALDHLSRSVAAGGTRRLVWTVDLDAEGAAAWLSAVNDARLILGCTLGITQESVWESAPDPDNPTSVVIFWLGWLQEELVAALMRTLPDS
ncbi:MAG: DUF2017 domain-containing protein [Actinomycetota bacterium]|nr:DUF2017 family protein [Euzebyaceae bacterium]MDQ3453549.1 DUF2017 domain-containing protein [Actinomycetota bacterium]